MIVIAIIGILASIAIAQFQSYRRKGFNSGAVWDVKNAASAQEAYYVDFREYATSLNGLEGDGLSSTEGVDLSLSAGNGAYTLISFHSEGDRTYTLTGPGGVLKSN